MVRNWSVVLSLVAIALSTAAGAAQQLPTKRVLTLEAIRKARTAVFFQGETKRLEEEVTKGGRAKAGAAVLGAR